MKRGLLFAFATLLMTSSVWAADENTWQAIEMTSAKLATLDGSLVEAATSYSVSDINLPNLNEKKSGNIVVTFWRVGKRRYRCFTFLVSPIWQITEQCEESGQAK